VALTLIFAQRMYAELGFDGELAIDWRWTETKGRKLVFNTPALWHPDQFQCAEPSICESVRVPIAQLQAGGKTHSRTDGQSALA
jgi:hypothetical protein